MLMHRGYRKSSVSLALTRHSGSLLTICVCRESVGLVGLEYSVLEFWGKYILPVF